jgi:hypothetical protein
MATVSACSRTQTVERGLEDRLHITGVAVDRRDGVEHVEDLLESEVVANLAGVLRGGEQRPARGDNPGPAPVKYGVAATGVLEQLGGDVALAREEAEEPAQPADEARAWSLPGGGLGGPADGVDFLSEQSLADETGITLIQMAIAFAVRHPAVTSAIIGPRTMEHLDSYLAADGIGLSGDVLDRIDEIVPPGATINVSDNYWEFGTRALDATNRRR